MRPPSSDLAGQQVDADQPGRHLVDLRDRDAVDVEVPLVRRFSALKRTIECIRRTIAAASKPRPVALERAGHRRHGEEARGLVDAPRGLAAAERAGQRHRQRGVGVQERRHERAADDVGREQRLRDPLVARALVDELHVEPVGRCLHRRDEALAARAGRRARRRCPRGTPSWSMSIRPLKLCSRHQRRVGVGDHVAEHRRGAHELDQALVGQQLVAGGRPRRAARTRRRARAPAGTAARRSRRRRRGSAAARAGCGPARQAPGSGGRRPP